MTPLLQDFLAARRVSTPLMAIQTPDPTATIKDLRAGLPEATPILSWDCVRGLQEVNPAGRSCRTDLLAREETPGENLSPTGVLDLLRLAAPDAVVFYQNAPQFYTERGVLQGIHNLRDLYKRDQRTLVLLGQTHQLPVELRHDVLVLDEPLPDREKLGDLVTRQFQQVRQAYPEIPAPTPEVHRKAVDHLQGLSLFTAENSFAMAITREGLNFHQLQEVRRHMIEQTPGLSVVKKSVSYWDLGGLSFAKKFADLLFSHSPRPPSALIWIDELEKMFGGGEGREDGGVDRDAHRVILNAMQEYGWTGMIALGPPGSGKSEFAKATGQTYGVPTLEFDLGATRDSLVGQSEQAIRQVVKVIHGIAGAGAFFVGTANTLDHLRPELIRRFKCGIWMFDLPDRLEKDRIWEIWIGKYGLPAQDLPEDTDWSGSDIANCCWTAWMTHASLVEAAQFLTLSAQANPQAVEQLRKLAAHNKFRSASYPGPYQYVPLTSLQDTAPETRRFEL